VNLAVQEVAERRPSPLVRIRIRGDRRAFIREALVTAFGLGTTKPSERNVMRASTQLMAIALRQRPQLGRPDVAM
jgi:hypothetical protein